jgi:hypothetical protein
VTTRHQDPFEELLAAIEAQPRRRRPAFILGLIIGFMLVAGACAGTAYGFVWLFGGIGRWLAGA